LPEFGPNGTVLPGVWRAGWSLAEGPGSGVVDQPALLTERPGVSGGAIPTGPECADFAELQKRLQLASSLVQSGASAVPAMETALSAMEKGRQGSGNMYFLRAAVLRVRVEPRPGGLSEAPGNDREPQIPSHSVCAR
jgi:hypothetical protein